MKSLLDQGLMNHWNASMALMVSKDEFLAGVAAGKYPKPKQKILGVNYWDGLEISRLCRQRHFQRPMVEMRIKGDTR